jgi:septum site-determining protein MinC
MSPASPGPGSPTFEIKSAQWPLVALLLRTTNLDELQLELQQRFGDTPDFFDQDPLLLDLSALQDEGQVPNFDRLLPLLRSYRLQPLAFKGGGPEQIEAARIAGLVSADEATFQRSQLAEAVASAPVPAAPATPTGLPALLIDKPLRSGQQVYARGRDLVVMAMVNPGAEVIADGHIHVYAPLRGKAIAGARGETSARIFAASLEAELVSIAGVYRTSDTPLPADVAGKPAQVRLESGPAGDKLILEPIL